MEGAANLVVRRPVFYRRLELLSRLRACGPRAARAGRDELGLSVFHR